MSEHWEIYADWNPWHGCTKISPGCYQLSQAHKANIDYKIGNYLVPEKVRFEWKDSDYHN